MVVILEAGHHLFDVVANAIVVGAQAEPIDAGFGRRALHAAMLQTIAVSLMRCGLGGREDAAAFLDDAHRVFAADELLAAALHVFFGSS